MNFLSFILEFTNISTESSKPGLVVHAYNFTIQEAEARGSRVRGQVWLQSSKQLNQEKSIKNNATNIFIPTISY